MIILKYLKNDKDIFDAIIKNKFHKTCEIYEYVYKDNNYTSKNIYGLLEALIYSADKVIFDNKKTNYKIFDISKNFSKIESIIKDRSIYKIISYSDEIIEDKNVYYINKKLSKNSLYKIFDIYSGIVKKNCYVIFIINDKRFCLSKSFYNFNYRKNDKGVMCLDINHECWEY